MRLPIRRGGMGRVFRSKSSFRKASTPGFPLQPLTRNSQNYPTQKLLTSPLQRGVRRGGRGVWLLAPLIGIATLPFYLQNYIAPVYQFFILFSWLFQKSQKAPSLKIVKYCIALAIKKPKTENTGKLFANFWTAVRPLRQLQ
jgi:hypothetical protein